MKEDTKVSRRGFLTGLAALGASGVAASTGTKLGTPPSAWAAADAAKMGGAQILESEPYEHGDVVETDVLIVGSGIAGLWAAIKASDAGAKSIAVVDKGAIGFSSIASLIAGSTVYVLPGEDVEGVMGELVTGSGYLSRQDLWEDMLGSSAELYQELTENMGIEYKGPRRQSDGNIYTTMSSGIEWNGITSGRGYVSALVEQLRGREGIRYFSKTMVTEILKDGDKAAGVVGVNRVTGDVLAVKAKSVVLATGQCSFRGQHALQEVNTGDGYQLAYKAGATLNNMEFWAFDIDPKDYGFEGGSLLEPYGANLVNKNNYEFMWDVDPVNGSAADVRYTTRAMAKEVQAGRAPIFMDRTTYQYALIGQFSWLARLAPGSWRKINDIRMTETGHDVVLEPEEYVPTSFGIIGAIKTDRDLMTDVPGLFVSSVALSSDPGKTKGIESLRAAWSGRKAGANAAAYAAGTAAPALDDAYLAERIAAAAAPLRAADEAADPDAVQTPNEITRKLHEIIMDYRVSLLPNEGTLTTALREVRELKDEAAATMLPADPHEAAKYYETLNILDNAELHLMASLERKETRVCHYREDFPEMDNGEWLKWIEWSRGADGEPVMSLTDMPIEEYPLKPGKEA